MPYDLTRMPTGPAPTCGFEFIELPQNSGGVEGGIRPDQFIPFTKLSTWFIESFFMQVGVWGDRIDLIDGARIYRVEVKYLWRFPSDLNGPFIPTPQGVYRFVVDRPRPTVGAVNEWTPCGP